MHWRAHETSEAVLFGDISSCLLPNAFIQALLSLPVPSQLSEYVTLNLICSENVHITHAHSYSPNPFSTPVFFKEY